MILYVPMTRQPAAINGLFRGSFCPEEFLQSCSKITLGPGFFTCLFLPYSHVEQHDLTG